MTTKTTHTRTTTNHTNTEATMKTKKAKTAHATKATPAEPAAAAPEVAATKTPAPPGSIPAQLQAIEQTCGYGDTLSDKVRATSEGLIHRVPMSIIERIITLAVRGGGTVAGISFDPSAATSALAAADEADQVATAAQILARRAQDQSIRLRAGVSGNASAIRTALRGYVKTPQGASLASESEELSSLAKQHLAPRKARKTRAENVAAATSTAAPAPAEPATPATTPSTAPPPTAPKAG
jgi:hypothetical protein